MANKLHQKLDNEDDRTRILTVLAMIIIGGIGINGTRHASIGMDCFFRIVSGCGFVGFVYYLGKVSDIVLVESMK